MTDSTASINMFVAGFGRCGTTAMMRLLWHAGAPVMGLPPAFEDPRLCVGTTDLEWVRAQRGRIVKWIDPANSRLPRDYRAKTIWLHRRPKDQAQSQAKFLRETGVAVSSNQVRMLTRSLELDRPRTLASLRTRGPVLIVRFASLLKDPEIEAQRVQEFLGDDIVPDPQAGAQAIISRSPECMPDMRIEIAGIKAWQRVEAADG